MTTVDQMLLGFCHFVRVSTFHNLLMDVSEIVLDTFEDKVLMVVLVIDLAVGVGVFALLL
jgi:hypothetical protein